MPEKVTVELPSQEECGPIRYNSRAQSDRFLDSKMARILGFKRKSIPNIAATGRTIIYIYSVTERVFPTWRIPGFPQYTIQPCPSEKQYGEPIEIKELYFEEYLGEGTTTEQNPWNGEEIAFAVINVGPGIPANLDLRLQGVFMSRSNPPKHEEVEEARKAADRYANRLVIEANIAYRAGNLKDINEEHRWAANWMHQEVDWNKTGVKMVDCPHCGGAMVSTAAVHFGQNGCGGVVDWDRAIAAGLKRESDRPTPRVVDEPKGRPKSQ